VSFINFSISMVVNIYLGSLKYLQYYK